jgi:hypothetical protein
VDLTRGFLVSQVDFEVLGDVAHHLYCTTSALSKFSLVLSSHYQVFQPCLGLFLDLGQLVQFFTNINVVTVFIVFHLFDPYGVFHSGLHIRVDLTGGVGYL